MSAFVLCDDSDQVDLARRREPSATIVAVTPGAAWRCQQLGVPYDVLDRSVSAVAMTAFGEATTEAAYRWAAWCDFTLAKQVPSLAEPGFTPARAQLYYIKRCLDAHILPASLLRRFVESVRPARLVVFAQERPTFPDFTVAPGRPYFAWLAEAAVGDLTGVEVWPVPSGETREPPPLAAKPRLADRLAPAVVARRLIRALRDLRACLPGPRVAWLGRGYDWEQIAPELEQRGVRVIECSERIVMGRGRTVTGPSALREQMRATWLAVREKADLWAPLDAVTPRLRVVAAPFLEQLWVTEIPRIHQMFVEARNWLQRRRIGTMVSVDIQSPFMGAASMAARNLGLTRVMSIHTPPGGAAELQVQDAIGPILSDVYLLNGTGDEAYFGTLAARFGTFERARNVLNGSVRLERLAETGPLSAARVKARIRGKDTRPIVLYVPAAFEGPLRYFNGGFNSDVAYLELQQRILRICAQFPGVRVLYKPRTRDNGADVMEQFISRCVPNGDVTWTPMTDLLWAVDAVVIDHPSTTLAEASMTDKPLLIYGDRIWGRLLPTAKGALAHRALVSESPDEFASQVQSFLERNDFTPLTSPDATFRRLFVTHLDDGCARDRAATLVESVIRQGSLQSTPRSESAEHA